MRMELQPICGHVGRLTTAMGTFAFVCTRTPEHPGEQHTTEIIREKHSPGSPTALVAWGEPIDIQPLPKVSIGSDRCNQWFRAIERNALFCGTDVGPFLAFRCQCGGEHDGHFRDYRLDSGRDDPTDNNKDHVVIRWKN